MIQVVSDQQNSHPLNPLVNDQQNSHPLNPLNPLVEKATKFNPLNPLITTKFNPFNPLITKNILAQNSVGPTVTQQRNAVSRRNPQRRLKQYTPKKKCCGDVRSKNQNHRHNFPHLRVKEMLRPCVTRDLTTHHSDSIYIPRSAQEKEDLGPIFLTFLECWRFSC